MVVNQTAEYALRAMAVLAELPAGEALRASDLAEQAEVPTHYLSKILRRLVVAGLLKSQKGHGGGFVLARPPSRIRFADILEATDSAVDAKRCAFGWGRCNPTNPCPLHPAWTELNANLEHWAKTTTLTAIRERAARDRPSR